MSRIVVVIPTLNEVENLPLLVPEVLKQDPGIEVLVVDDDSPDGTGRLADELAAGDDRIHVLHRYGKRGLGNAYREGLAHALTLEPELILQMDADFSHPPDTIPTMLREIVDYDVILGSRYLNGITVVNWPIERILLSYYGNWYVRQVTQLPIRDTTGGFRCIRSDLLRRIDMNQVRSDGYSFQIEMNYRFVKQGARIKEIPFFFLDRIRGTSKLTMRIGLEALWMAWWLKVSDWLGRL